MYKILAGIIIIYKFVNFEVGNVDVTDVAIIAGIALIGAGLDTLSIFAEIKSLKGENKKESTYASINNC